MIVLRLKIDNALDEQGDAYRGVEARWREGPARGEGEDGMSKTIAVGDVVTVRFDGTTLPSCVATVTAINGPMAHIRYEDGVFHGLRGMIRLPGWTRWEPRAGRTA